MEEAIWTIVLTSPAAFWALALRSPKAYEKVSPFLVKAIVLAMVFGCGWNFAVLYLHRKLSDQNDLIKTAKIMELGTFIQNQDISVLALFMLSAYVLYLESLPRILDFIHDRQSNTR